MALSLYNTLTRRKELFEPFDRTKIGMYVCGPTVYDLAHIGNARPIVVFDVLYRLLRRIYGEGAVTYVRNITDVDDKINAAAKISGEPIASITALTTEAFHADIAELNALPPDVEPRATEHIAEMIEMIEALITSEHAYAADGHVLFHVPSFPEYGKLSHRDRDEMISGARIEVAPYKRDPADFVLWKPSDLSLPGWNSPWGRGRPGWHIECSAMSRKHLGTTIDIHGGGSDLIFPHHENEVAQSECSCPGHPFARYWMHNGFLSVNGEKMSKSLGNFITIRQALGRAPGEVLRLMMLSTHYRHPLNWTESGLKQAQTRLDRLYRLLQKSGARVPDGNAVGLDDGFVGALQDDLNTPLALAELERQADELMSADARGREQKRVRLLASAGILGILQQDPEAWFKGGETAEDVSHIEAKIERRLEARQAKDFALADNIRESLAENGIILEDRPDGTTDWRRTV
ncbi:MAG: cysteine--tRNA ligase [Rhodospirillaceae bacterium]|nr:cysteine--tRNA ligase [Rhodospirillaceae bacterium]